MRLLLLMMSLAACGHRSVKPNPGDYNMTSVCDQQPRPVVVATSTTTWTIEMTRVLGAQRASGRVIVAIAPTATNTAPHSALASAEAWLAVAGNALNAGASNDAVNAVRCGIAELGDNYRPKGIKDDTGIHLLDAYSTIAGGRTTDGAKELVAILRTRIALYFKRYEGEVQRLSPDPSCPGCP